MDAPAGELRMPPLHGRHLAAGARLTPFAGWQMPLHYSGIVAEHTAVREHAGVFDVSHMGRALVDAPAAGEAIRAITTFGITALEPGQAHYSLYCAEDGGIADDIFVYRLGERRWLLVHNAARAAVDCERLKAAVPTAQDITHETGMLAIQGPAARAIAAGILGQAVLALPQRRCLELPWHGETVLVARTGYTGEDGLECVLPAAAAGELWDALLGAGVTPCGLGARDTLRLEAALPLYGNDIDLSTNPFEAGLGWVVSFDDGRAFTGREALLALRDRPPARRLSCLLAEGRAVPRAGYPVLAAAGSQAVGTCTSGAYSPTLRAGIAMAYLPIELAQPGTPLAIGIRGHPLPVTVVARPFYRRKRQS